MKSPPDPLPLPVTGPDGAERRGSGMLYGRDATETTGPLQDAGNRVQYRRVPGPGEHRAMLGIAGTHILLAAALVVYLLMPGNLPRFSAGTPVTGVIMAVGLALMILLQLIVGLRTWVLAYFAARAVDPVPVRPAPGLRVAVLTTGRVAGIAIRVRPAVAAAR